MILYNKKQKQLNKSYIKSTNSQQGFTLVELMISLVLGLLITAAVMQVYFVSTKASVIQASGSNIVDSNIFGLQTIEEYLKLANLGLATNATGTATYSGIVLDATTNLKGVKLQDGGDIPAALLTRSNSDTVGNGNQWTGISNTNKVSSQLTIQYRAPQKTYDCEGKVALGPRKVDINGESSTIDGQIVIERYFLRQNSDGKLILACDAGRYINEVMDDYSQQGVDEYPITQFTAKNRIKEFGDAGQEIISNIDDFQVLLGVLTPTGIRYVTPHFYTDTSNGINGQPIVAIKLGIIARGDLAMPGNEEGRLTFNLLGQDITINDDQSKKVIRQSYESNIMLRNARQL